MRFEPGCSHTAVRHANHSATADCNVQCSKMKDLVATFVGFVAAAVSKPMGGCRARRSLVVDVDVAAELAVL